MDTSVSVATWIGSIATTIGLASVITQASAIHSLLDPFHNVRGSEHLGLWAKRQPSQQWLHLLKPVPLGPSITASLTEGFCYNRTVRLSRKPPFKVGSATWTSVLAVLHPGTERSQMLHILQGYNIELHLQDSAKPNDMDKVRHKPPLSTNWNSLQMQSLRQHGGAACTTISRSTFITLLVLTNSRQIFKYSGAAGHRASYPSYNGLWNIEWPIGSPAVLRFSPHDSHSSSDPYPPFFTRRVDKCIQMLAGIIETGTLTVAFPGRKTGGSWILEWQPKGFNGAHGSRHLYNMLGGKPHEVDMLFRRELPQKIAPIGSLKLSVPSLSHHDTGHIYIMQKERDIIAHAMDCLPWTTLSWSMHRGMKDILIAYGKPIMDIHRFSLATMLKKNIEENPHALETKGWDSKFVKQSMADMAYATVMSGVGDSGDLVRVIADAALLLWDRSEAELDQTRFWRDVDFQVLEQIELTSTSSELSIDAVIALTKYVVLEWSQELDYQMYHDLPMEILVA